jgi:hypothetical protein
MLRDLAGVGGFENCPFTPNCPIFKELKILQDAAHNLFTDSNEKPLEKPFRMIRVSDDE